MKKIISLILLLTLSSLAFADIDNPPNDGSQKTQIVDGSGNVIGSTANAIDVNIKSGASSGTQYTEGDVDATITGTAALMEGAGNALVPLQGNATDGQLVNLGANNDVTVTGTVTANQGGTWTVQPGNTANTTAWKVDGSAVTQPVSGTVTVTDGAGALNVIVDSSALPSGASTAAKQPALGTAGTASSDVITVQGIASMIALKVDGSDVTQPVSGTFWQATQPVSGTVTVTDGAGALNVIVDSGTTTVTQGTATSLKAQVFGDDTTQALDVDAAGQLQIDVLTMPTTTVTATNLDVQIGGSDSLTIGTFPDNEPFNVAQIGGTSTPVATAATDTTGAGVQQVGPLYQADDVATTACTENRFCHPRINATRRSVLIEGVASGTAVPVSFTGSTDAATQTTLASVLTSVQLIDDPVFTDDTSTHSTGTSKGFAMMGAATPTDTAVNANDFGVLGMTNNRELYVSIRDIAGATAVSGSGTATGALRVELANNGTGLVTTNPATAANWGIYVEDAAETAGGNLDMAGSVRRDAVASSAGTTGDNATINTTAEGGVWVTPTPSTTSGLSVFNATSGDTFTALTNAAQAIKGSAGVLYGWYIYNPNSSAVYVNIYNIAAASVTVGTSTPTLNFAIPATSGANIMGAMGITFGTAISASCTTTGGGNTAPSTACEAMFFYK